jgi:hypothetical protein
MALVCVAGPAVAQASCTDLCSVLPNCGFDAGFAGWTCTRPNGNYECQPPFGPELDVPAAIAPGPDDAFVGVLNPGDRDIAGKVVHDAERIPYTPGGTCFEVKVWANRGRLPNPLTPFVGAPPTVLVRVLGWTSGPDPLVAPVVDPATDNWSRRPNAMNCAFPAFLFTPASQGQWVPQVFQCTATQHLSWVSLSIAGVNHSHDSYAAFDVTPADFP